MPRSRTPTSRPSPRPPAAAETGRTGRKRRRRGGRRRNRRRNGNGDRRAGRRRAGVVGRSLAPDEPARAGRVRRARRAGRAGRADRFERGARGRRSGGARPRVDGALSLESAGSGARRLRHRFVGPRGGRRAVMFRLPPSRPRRSAGGRTGPGPGHGRSTTGSGPRRDPGVGRGARRRHRRARRGAGAVPAPAPARPRATGGRCRCRRRPRPTSTPSRATSSRRTPATARSSGASRACVRWNAMAMVVRANKHEDGHRRPHLDLRLGGDALRGRLQPLLPRPRRERLRRRPGLLPGPRLARASTPAPSSKGASSAPQLENFRRELAPGGGLSSYPHPWLMPDFWEFPTVSMGLGPIMAIYQARFN